MLIVKSKSYDIFIVDSLWTKEELHISKFW